MNNKIVTVSALDKVFIKGKPKLIQQRATQFKNEKFHFQICCKCNDFSFDTKVEVESDIAEFVSVRVVESVPSIFGTFIGRRDKYVIKKNGNGEMYPDLLRPLFQGGETLRPFLWQAFWVTVDGTKKDLPLGEHTMKLTVKNPTGEYNESCLFTVEVLDETLSPHDLIVTNWIDYNSICAYHRVLPFTEEFYEVFSAYLENYLSHGNNTLYLPAFSLDYDGKKIPFIGAEKKGEGYVFDFGKLEEFIRFAISRGVKYLEFFHIASAQKVENCLDVFGKENGEEKLLFAGNEPLSEEYFRFIDVYTQALNAFLTTYGWLENSLFHIADEPRENFLPTVKRFADILKANIRNARIMDALERERFFKQGIIDMPVVAVPIYKIFPSKYMYYCACHRHSYYTNRHFNMPLQRVRILGFQLYLNGMKGFLHWGYNWWSNRAEQMNPYFYTDGCSGCWESGDSFIVYPSKRGVYDSNRHEMMLDAYQDYAALKLLERYIGRKEVLKLLYKEGFKAGFEKYPRSAKWHFAFRQRINALIMEHRQK